MEKDFWNALEIVRDAGEIISKFYFGRNFEKKVKSDDTPVTQADVAANEAIVHGLQSYFPEDGVVSEELEGVIGTSGRVWYIDPIDGTKGFVRRTDQFAVHLGLAEEGRPVLGLVYKPLSGECYVGLNSGEKRAFVVNSNGVEYDFKIGEGDSLDALRFTGSLGFDDSSMRDFIKSIPGSSMIFTGSFGLRISKLLENLADAHVSDCAAGTWDVCAPHALLEAAGGFLRYQEGGEVVYNSQRKLESKVLATRTMNQMDFLKRKINSYDFAA